MLPPPEPTSPNRPVPGPGEKQMRPDAASIWYRPDRRMPAAGRVPALRRPWSPKRDGQAGRTGVSTRPWTLKP